MRKKEHRLFLNTFFSEKKQVGSVAPSSRFLVRSMCDKIDFEQVDVVLELGPGTGVFTKELLRRARADSRVILFEINATFYQQLVDTFCDERLTILHRSADRIQDALREMGVGKADVILSSLPLAVIPTATRDHIVQQSYENLKQGGTYVQYQYSLSAKKLLEKTFGKIQTTFVPINVPPAFVYLATKA